MLYQRIAILAGGFQTYKDIETIKLLEYQRDEKEPAAVAHRLSHTTSSPITIAGCKGYRGN